MDPAKIFQSQYLSALEMLKQVIVRCPAACWDAPGDKDRFWNKAYHALFYAHLYLHQTREEFKPWEKHRDPKLGEVYSQEEVLEYLAVVQEQVGILLLNTDFEAGSGFHWLPFNKFELQVYNIRHIQQHVGELYERLGTRHDIELDWVSMIPEQS